MSLFRTFRTESFVTCVVTRTLQEVREADNNIKNNRGSNLSARNLKLESVGWSWALLCSTYFHFNICSHNPSVVKSNEHQDNKTATLFSNVNAEGKGGTVFLSSQKQNTSTFYNLSCPSGR
uniref:Uncharacterized protein n=1 Tax=Pyxicephalus adspersus TaxID=30357 RepID=A0AAV3B1C7_PYXAD|nr:TPA: hypothetical protein GDO54_006780 [Pyxicephalus adspersus]